MKKIFGVFAMIMMMVTSVFAQIPSNVDTNGLYKYYDFTQTLPLNGVGNATDRFGKANSADSVTSSSKTQEFFKLSANGTKRSVSFWTKIDTTINASLLSCADGYSKYSNRIFTFDAKTISTDSVKITVNNSQSGIIAPIIIFNIKSGIWDNIVFTIIGNNSVSKNTIVVFNNGKFVDSLKVNSATVLDLAGTGVQGNVQPVDIGFAYQDQNPKFRFLIDDIAWYNRTLTFAEMANFYDLKSTTDTTKGDTTKTHNHTGIANVNSNTSKVITAPNPSNGSFNLLIDAKNSNTSTVNIVNIAGQLVQKTVINVSSGMNTIPMLIETKGTYIIQVINEESVSQSKLIVE